MSNGLTSSLEKTVWTYKQITDESLMNENSEFILNFFDRFKFELNINRYSASFTIDVDKYLEYPEDNNIETSDIDKVFDLKYHHSLIMGTYSIDPDNKQSIMFNIEKIFTNEDEQFGNQNQSLEGQLENNLITFDTNSFLNEIIATKQPISLKQQNYKNKYFYKVKLLSNEYKYMKPAFESHSYEICQFLTKEDLKNLKLANKFFYDLCDCYLLFEESISSLQNLFKNSIINENIENTDKLESEVQNNSIEVKGSVKKSKFKEKFDFNKSMNEFYKGSDTLNKRIQSGKRRTKK